MCSFWLNINTVNTTSFVYGLKHSKKQKTTKKNRQIQFEELCCHVFPRKTLMTTKDVLLLLHHRYQFPAAKPKYKFQNSFDQKAYLGADFFFSYSNSEYIHENNFHLKGIKSNIGTFRLARLTATTFSIH